MQAAAMDEESFWTALSFRVTHEMAGVDECRRRGMWCDGLIAHTFDLGASPNRICGQAWVGFGPRDQEAWTFELLLPASADSRGAIRWSGLLPAEDVTNWLSVDHEAKHLVVARGDAVDDVA